MGSDDPYYFVTKKDPDIDDCDGGEVCFSLIDCVIIGGSMGIAIATLMWMFIQ